MEWDYDSDEINFKNSQRAKNHVEEVPLWDSFQDNPEVKASGSAANKKRFNSCMVCLKLFVYFFVFSVVLCACVLSRISYLLMASNLKPNTTSRYCDNRYPYKELYVLIAEKQQIFWVWAIIFAFSAPELFSFLGAVRTCILKNFQKPNWRLIALIATMETFHVIGLAIFTFTVLPEISPVQGLMLTNCVCLLPSVLGLVSACSDNCKSLFKVTLNTLAVLTQITGFIFWPLMQASPKLLGLTTISLLLISFRWWENYISGIPSIKPLIMIALRKKLTKSRHHIYLYVSPLKIFIFALSAILLDGKNIGDYFTEFSAGWKGYEIIISEFPTIYSDRNSNDTSPNYSTIGHSNHWKNIAIMVIHIVASFICYNFAKFACKIKIQKFSFSCALSIAVPVSFVCITILNGLEEANICIFHGYLADYLAFKNISIYDVTSPLVNNNSWIWILWWLSQLWITRHIWFPQNDKNASTAKLFITPWYSSLLLDQCIMLNRRRLDKENYVNFMDVLTFVNPETHGDNSTGTNIDVRPGDEVPQLIVCATMWHELEDEMLEFLKSILRLDEDQCSRRLAAKYLPGNYDNEYYELESHIFFDDAFIVKCNDKNCKDPKCIDPNDPPINEYVETLIENIEKAACKVYNTKITIKAPIKIETPYGGRLIWTLPGQTKLIAHLKNVKKIRNKKRWSQVMYMYYLLGYRIMEMNASPQRKTVIAQNTFILALDGDIDFQPEAVLLLISRMKVNPLLGAACGRIHPVGKGPIVWFQIFEYAIGHWLQKATEHVIGCVLCSPGCFSLFRGLALIDNSVIKKYTTVSTQPRHHIQYDQGEDRWLCTLLLKQRFSVEYVAASDAYTHAPEGFFEFFKQRRRWIPSTIANIFDLLSDAKSIVKKNNSISKSYILYQLMLLIGNILGPGTIFLMLVGAFVTVFNIDILTSFMWNFFPVLIFMIICYFCEQNFQLTVAFVMSSIYSLIMMGVLIAIILQMKEDGILSPTSLFFVVVGLQIVVTACLHPQEFTALFCGLFYFITIPSMYMILMIYSVFNMNDSSWGTRENTQNQGQNGTKQQTQKNQSTTEKFPGNSTEEQDKLFDFSFGNVLHCTLCTKQGIPEAQLFEITNSLKEINAKLTALEIKTTEEVNPKKSENAPKADNTNNTESKKLKQHPPGWSSNAALDNCTLESLSIKEKIFWDKFIHKYLRPLNKTEEEQKEIDESLHKFKNTSVFAFVMLNALFVITVFLLQLKKSSLHILWPFNVNNIVKFDETTLEVKIFRKYLELDPIGSVLVLLFGTILVIQFLAMLVHRFGTLSQILAAIELNWSCSTVDKENSTNNRMTGTMVDLAKYLQRPSDEDSDIDEEEKYQNARQSVIHKIHFSRESRKSVDWSNLEKNFERRYRKKKTLDYGKIPLDRKSIKLIDEKRKSMSASRAEQGLGGYDNHGFTSESQR